MGYEVTFWSPLGNHTEIFSSDTYAAPFNVTQISVFSDNKVTVTVIAKNSDGVSQPAGVLLPLHLTGMCVCLFHSLLVSKVTKC